MSKLFITVLLTTIGLNAQDKLLKASLIGLVASTSIDLSTAYHYNPYERNSLLRNPQGHVSLNRAIAWKGSSAVTMTFVATRPLTRKQKLALAITNFALTGLYVYGTTQNIRHRQSHFK